ncbi:hypothetical protein CAP35_12585 [Chitinophagaceae bacterium IBVUCB1]|nr:hypothetical protein CAP35_12585 [Chitinophagaceae bacterium IBVUCB1]
MQTVLNTEVSLYANYIDAKPRDTISLLEWLTAEDYKEEIMAIRKCKSVDKLKTLKKQLPAITPSGIFNEKRALNSLDTHSGFICVDIDGKDNPHIKEWANVKQDVGLSPNVAYAGLSASGNGVFVLIPIAYPERHIEHFNAIEFYFLTKLKIRIDTACKDVSRLRGISYDDAAYFNHNAEPLFTCLQSANIGSLRQDNPEPDTSAVKRVLSEILSLKTDITENYQDWFSIGCVIANTYGEKGREKYHNISKFSPKYKYAECDRQYTACLHRHYKYSVGTLIHIWNKYKA